MPLPLHAFLPAPAGFLALRQPLFPLHSFFPAQQSAARTKAEGSDESSLESHAVPVPLHSFLPLHSSRAPAQPLWPLHSFLPRQQSFARGSVVARIGPVATGRGGGRTDDAAPLGVGGSIGAITLTPGPDEHATSERPARSPCIAARLKSTRALGPFIAEAYPNAFAARSPLGCA